MSSILAMLDIEEAKILSELDFVVSQLIFARKQIEIMQNHERLINDLNSSKEYVPLKRDSKGRMMKRITNN